MRKKRIGFIGGGKMGRAIVKGLISSGLADKDHIIVADADADRAAALSSECGIETTTKNEEVSSAADILFLTILPGILPVVIPEIRDKIKEDVIIVSIAAGTRISRIEDLFSKPVKVVRVMPNMPAAVSASMSAMTCNSLISDDDMAQIKTIFDCLGQSEEVSEDMMDVVVGVSGSSPAYVYMFIEAMADAAVADGMHRKQAYKFASQAVFGAAKMMLETGKSPSELKDAICSPGGTTAEAVASLEKNGFRGTIIEAQRACVKKSKKMSSNLS